MNQCLYYEDGKGSLPLSLIDCFLFFFSRHVIKTCYLPWFTITRNNWKIMFSVHCDCFDYYFYLMDITFLPLCRIILNVRFTISNINRLSTLIINTKYRVNLLEGKILQFNEWQIAISKSPRNWWKPLSVEVIILTTENGTSLGSESIQYYISLKLQITKYSLLRLNQYCNWMSLKDDITDNFVFESFCTFVFFWRYILTS